MNKTKRVAWHKHLKKAQKHKERARAQRASATPARTPASRR